MRRTASEATDSDNVCHVDAAVQVGIGIDQLEAFRLVARQIGCKPQGIVLLNDTIAVDVACKECDVVVCAVVALQHDRHPLR